MSRTRILQIGKRKRMSNKDNIKPDHYQSPIDVIKFCQANKLDFLQGNVIKYVVRYKAKNGLEDLRKAEEYIIRMIKEFNNIPN
jgi:hypothetical protein